jgi:hypothetical protein
MAARTGAGARRRRWHPLTGAGGLTVTAFAVAVAVTVRPAPGLPLGAWLLLGTAAGFATSGST